MRVVEGAAGEMGAAPGERLTARHEFLVTRTATGTSVPIQLVPTPLFITHHSPHQARARLLSSAFPVLCALAHWSSCII